MIDMTKKLLTCTEAAAELGIPHRTLQYRAAQGLIKATRLGRDWYFKPADVAKHAKNGVHVGRPAGKKDGYKRTRRKKAEA